MFKKVEINIPLLDAIKQVPRYTKFLKELCIHKRKKKGVVKTGGIMSALVKHENTSVQRILPKKCQDLGIFVVPCINQPSIYRLLNLGDLEPIGMVIQLANRSIVQPLGILEDVLIQVNELIFLADFYVLDIEDESSREGLALILG
ncbi:hypothetical protein CR513_33661, partial [Mucuna pruriens]